MGSIDEFIATAPMEAGIATPAASAAVAQDRFTLGDLMDRGLSPAAPVELDDWQPPAGETVVSAFKKAAAMAHADGRLTDLVAALDIVRDPAALATLMISRKYAELGGAGGVLGSTVASVTPCPDGKGFFRNFQHGVIYWHPALGAHEVHGAILDKWTALGRERSFLGYPMSDQRQGRDPARAGHYSHFQRGSIYWHPRAGVQIATLPASAVLSAAVAASATRAEPTMSVRPAATTTIVAGEGVRPLPIRPIPTSAPAYEVHGAIRAKYLLLGAEASVLGYPTTDETVTPDGIGRYNHFQAGSIYWTPRTGAYEVHGLIREFWAANGWERNPDLGYPISDELIPDRRIGHVHPESRRKPLLTVPADRVKLPAEAASVGFPRAAANVAVSPGIAPAAPTSMAVAVAQPEAVAPAPAPVAAGPAVAASTATIAPLAKLVLVPQPTSTPATQPSRNRFGDFEDGVLFWRRGDAQAQQLAPWSTAADGSDMRLTPSEIIQAAGMLSAAVGGVGGLTFAGTTFGGTTECWFDGIGVHNRRHRLLVQLTGMRTQGGFVPVPVAVNSQIEVLVEVAFEPILRKIVGIVTGWSLGPTSAQLAGDPSFVRTLHQRLDPLLWRRFDVLKLPDTNAGQPIALLSVKTMRSGEVNLYIEP
jgi:hypothetical protein